MVGRASSGEIPTPDPPVSAQASSLPKLEPHGLRIFSKMAVSTSQEDNTAPKSTHVAEATLQPFLQPTFDPAEYLNATLPSLSSSTVSSRPLKHGSAASLADLSSQTQDLLSQLNAHTTRLSTILTQMTDDILRSGGRLAYEVEVLRGDTIGLTETLSEGLKGDVEKFLPNGIPPEATTAEETEDSEPTASPPKADTTSAPAPADTTSPSHISELRTLTTIRTRLESVIKIFGEAMHWTLPPSEISLTSSLISVSAPTPSSTSSSVDLETRGKEFATALRNEISDLITGSAEPAAGFEAAHLRIQALRELATVWKGTAEEKARGRFVDGLVKLAEERVRDLEKNRGRGTGGGVQGRSGGGTKTSAATQPQKSGGFLDNLSRLRGNIYSE